MTLQSLNPEQFEALLRLLAPDRDLAGARYEHLRRRLISVFTYRGCTSPEDLADETMDRVARKLFESALKTEDRDPGAVVFGVAWNIARESFHRRRSVAWPEQWEPPDPAGLDGDMETKEREQECLDRCLSGLADNDRDLVLRYFQGEKGAKIQQRSRLCQQLRLSPNALRVKIHRITTGLRECVFDCVKSGGTTGSRTVSVLHR
jgi:DNA-directed RNA polymerase specialized sigma24 family protein